jgi:hypothetical protein
MKKLAWLVLVVVATGVGSFYGGYRVGELNGTIADSASNTGPLMNLLLVQAGREKDIVEMNREQLYGNLSIYDASQSSILVTPRNKRWSKQRILLARDYWAAAGGVIMQTEGEAKRTREQVAEIQAATGVQTGMFVNGVQVSPFYFEQEDRNVRELFGRYSGQTSALHDMIVKMVDEAKKRPNHSQEPAPSAVH